MPIFEKPGKRVYFAHIPKTAGVSVYCAFVESGWKIYNVTERNSPGSAFNILKDRYGVSCIPMIGSKFKFKHSIQHAPSCLWRLWVGPGVDSFAVIRSPLDRFVSTMRYRFERLSPDGDLDLYIDKLIYSVRKSPSLLYTGFDGHLIPQHWFVLKNTAVLDFDGDWKQELVSRYGLTQNSLRTENASVPRGYTKTAELERFIHDKYFRDFKLMAKYGYL